SSTIFNVLDTVLSTFYQIFAGNGDNVFNLTPARGFRDLDGIGRMAIYAGHGHNSLTLNDQDNTRAAEFDISYRNVHTRLADITFDEFADVTINGGSGGADFDVESAITPLTINGGAGDDTVHVASLAQNLELIFTTLAVNG